ncbi:MAG: hypothetical protein DHS20C20_17020 [Ardenticatenaceae bacterium]|nr:MAG: hypothetical protein DHS20C20_17020 [Ardenticatenaceae bacterium]
MEIIKRLFFVLLVTAVLVFFSEKMYWYPQGYVIAELILFYGVVGYACLWTIDYFRVERLPQLILVAGLYAFLTEGVLTPVIFEGGLFNPLMASYFIGWHGMLSVLFGFYLLRKWLRYGQWQRLLLGSVLVGFLWGIWSITYWLPETFADFASSGQWTVVEFGLHAFTFTLMLVAAHWLLGRGGWQPLFKPSLTERILLGLTLLFFFATLSFPAAPLGIISLMLLVTAVCLPLYFHRRRTAAGSLLKTLNGRIQARYLPILFVMPGLATAVYALATTLNPAEETLQAIVELLPLAQAALGLGLFLWALVTTLRSGRSVLPSPILELDPD